MRFYRALLTLYPKRFRREYRDELCRAFVERTRGRSWPVVAVAAIADVLPNALAARWDVLRHRIGPGLSVSAFSGDVRFAFRQIRRTPLLSGVIIAVVALGIGINAGLLTVINTYAWQPAPGIPRDAALARLRPMATRGQSGALTDVRLSLSDVLELRDRHDVFADLVAWGSMSQPVDFGGGSEDVLVQYTTANFFRALRVTLAAGAGFPDDLDESAAPVTVIAHSLWMSSFGGSSDAIGKTIRVMNVPFTIVGVAPPRFSGVDVPNIGRQMIWLPLGARAMLAPASVADLVRPGAATLRAAVRLAPGVHPGDVELLTSGLAARLAQDAPETHARLTLRAERLTGLSGGSADRTELVAAALLVAGLIVVITCTNVSALLLGRAAARKREIGVRLSLGATRFRLIRQMLTESLVLALSGAVLGLVLYIPTIAVAYATMPEIVYGLQAEPATFLFAMIFAVIATIAFGLAPALHATRTDIGEVIKNSGTHAIGRARLQMTFVVIQLACSQPVLVVTSMVLADIRRGANEHADQAPASVVTMSSAIARPAPVRSPSASADPDAGTDPQVLRAMRQRIMTIPGVQSAAISSDGIVPASSVRLSRDESFEVPGPGASGATAHLRHLYVSADYLATYGIPLLRGRAIGAEDDHPGSNTVVVNQAAAERLWPGEDSLGKRLIRRAAADPAHGADVATLEVIGVAGTAAYDSEESVPMVFAPLSIAASGWQSTIAVRASSDARAYLPPIRRAIRDVEPYAAVGDVSTLAERYAGARREAIQSNAAAFAVGAAALVLASLGLYAIIAFSVAQRTREIGVRLAMGASSGRIVRQFLRNGVVIAAIGLAVGLPVTVAGIQVVKASLLGFTLESVATVLIVVPVLVVVAALASWLPARRAGRVDPAIALRTD